MRKNYFCAFFSDIRRIQVGNPYGQTFFSGVVGPRKQLVGVSLFNKKKRLRVSRNFFVSGATQKSDSIFWGSGDQIYFTESSTKALVWFPISRNSIWNTTVHVWHTQVSKYVCRYFYSIYNNCSSIPLCIFYTQFLHFHIPVNILPSFFMTYTRNKRSTW